MLAVRQQSKKCLNAQPSVWEKLRKFSAKVAGNGSGDADLSGLMHGRKNMERRDSVNDAILLERQAHQLRIKSIRVDDDSIKFLTALGVGSKKRRNFVYKVQFNQFIDVDEGTYKKSQTGSGIIELLQY